MNAQEREVLENFLNLLTEIRGVRKDPEADAIIARAIAQQPDAAYLLVQRALLLEQALNQAKAQITELQSGRQPAGGCVLDSSTWGRSSSDPPRSGPVSVSGQPLPSTPTASQPYAGSTPVGTPSVASRGGGASSFLGQAVATAAGVAGGAFLFQGLESLLGHHGASFSGQASTQPLPGENVTKNDFSGNVTQRDEDAHESVDDDQFVDGDDHFTSDDSDSLV